MGKQLASIILITWNRLQYTQLCIQSILEKTIYQPYELIVVDNHSTDGTVRYLQELYQERKINELILLDQNYGAGYAMNRGVERAQGNYLIRSDNDMVYNRGWLQGLVDALTKLPRSLLQVAVFAELVEDGRRGGFANLVNGVKLKKISIGGCNMALTRGAYEELGPFPETMFAEDGIYCQRAQNKGYLVGQIDTATGTHIDEPGCSLSKRYSQYAEERFQRLEELQREGYDFLWEEDRKFYEEYRRQKHRELSQVVVDQQGVASKIVYITSGMEQNYPHKYIDEFITRAMESFPDQGRIFRLNIHTNWQTDLANFLAAERPEYVFTLHGCNLTADCVAQIQGYGAKVGIWLVDDPYDLDESKGRLCGYDYLLTNEKGCVPIYQKLGYEHAYYLPLGVAKEFYYPDQSSSPGSLSKYSSDLCFVGSPFPKRVEVLRTLANYFPGKVIKVVGPFWKNLLPRNIDIVNHHVEPEEIRKYYNQGKIILNIHREYNEHLYAMQSLNQDGIQANSPNNRTFDIAACRAFQLVDLRKGMADYFDLKRELVVYRSISDLLKKIDYYLSHPAKRQGFAEQAYQRTMAEHQMYQRLEEMFRLVGVGKEQCRKQDQILEVVNRMNEGRLIKGERPAVYLVLDGLKYLIPSVEIFEQLHLRWEDVEVVSQEEVDLIPDGGRVKS